MCMCNLSQHRGLVVVGTGEEFGAFDQFECKEETRLMKDLVGFPFRVTVLTVAGLRHHRPTR